MTAPLPAPPTVRLQRDRQARRWERQIDRQLQNQEILTLFHQIEREARLILLDPDASPAVRQAAQRQIDLCHQGRAKEREDETRDEQEAGELRVVDRELGDLASAHKVLDQRAAARVQSWRPGVTS